MKTKANFTKRDVVVFAGCLVFSLTSVGAIDSSGRRRAKRAVCLANLKQLALAWNIYADDNDDKIINGEAYSGVDGMAPVPTAGIHEGEKWWTGDDVAPDYMQGEKLPEQIQLRAIRAGALWPYCGDVKLYHCPSGHLGQVRNYSIVDSMNGLRRDGTYVGNVGVRLGETVLWVKKRTEITVPGPAYRMVFIDEGLPTPDSYAVHYISDRWWDPPPVRHGDGTNVSFADGHSEYWRWRAGETISVGTMAYPEHQFKPTTTDGYHDLHKMQRAVWGRLQCDPIDALTMNLAVTPTSSTSETSR